MLQVRTIANVFLQHEVLCVLLLVRDHSMFVACCGCRINDHLSFVPEASKTLAPDLQNISRLVIKLS